MSSASAARRPDAEQAQEPEADVSTFTSIDELQKLVRAPRARCRARERVRRSKLCNSRVV
jgi:hypothetical protein